MSGIADEALEKLLYFRREIDRIFNSLFAAKNSGPGPETIPIDIDIYENEQAFVLEAELAGIEREDIELSVLGDVLIIEGYRRRPEDRAPVQFLRMERRHGHFRRMLEIPGAGNTARVKARYQNGLLRVEVPKIAERRGQRRRIAIE